MDPRQIPAKDRTVRGAVRTWQNNHIGTTLGHYLRRTGGDVDDYRSVDADDPEGRSPPKAEDQPPRIDPDMLKRIPAMKWQPPVK